MDSEDKKTPETFDGVIHVIPYTHLDVAWVHTRAWHVDRYVRAIDEVLDMLDQKPEYRYYIDIWTELMRDYVELRPENVARISKHIRNGRLAVCSGHYGNVRSTNVGDETFVRNLQLGMAHWRELEPSVDLKVYANLDVTLGHTQMPQLLGLAGLTGYFAMRPLEALDAEDVPRTFIWRGLSGDAILVCRSTYGGLFMRSERHGKTWDTDFPAVVEGIWNGYLKEPVDDGVSNVALCVGSDDTRPERLLLCDDEPAQYPELMRIWNEREPSKMRYSHPNEFFTALHSEADKLKTIDKVLDPTDVSYNTANNGRRGIWWHRENCDRLIVDSEILSTLAALSVGEEYPAELMTDLWETLLNWTPHAVQYLFRQDWHAGEADLIAVAETAQKQIEVSALTLVNGCLAMDSDGIAVANSLPEPRKEIMPIWVMNTDLSRDLSRIVDVNGNPIPFQVVDYPVCNAELNIVAEVDIPAGGYTTFKYEWDPVPAKDESAPDITNAEPAPYWQQKYCMPAKKLIEDETFELASDAVKIVLKGGRIVSVQDLVSGTVREAPEGASFLEPVCFGMQKENNWYTYAIDDDPMRFEVTELRLDEVGPLRWRVTRTGVTGGYWVRQHIDLVKGERGVRSTAQFVAPAENKSSLIAMSAPMADDAQITVDIPFGIEPRNLAETKYGFAERSIPGFFWAKTWADTKDPQGRMALLAADGDKFFRAHGTPKRLVHFMAQKTVVFERSWEAYTDSFDVGGRQIFEHRLVLGGTDDSTLDLVDMADRIRHPLRYQYVPSEMLGESEELIKLAPSSVRMTALTCDDDTFTIRVVQMADEAIDAELALDYEPRAAEFVDFDCNRLAEEIAIDGKTLRFSLKPWQVATIVIGR